MSDSHDLPGEIILEIARFATPVDPSGIGYPIGPEELRNLRLVSKRFNNLISPLLFSILHLHFGDVDNRKSPMPDFIRCQEIITALATRSTSVFHHTKKLRLYIGIRYRVESEGILSVWTLLTDNIFDAICGLKNLRTIQSVRVEKKIPNAHPRSIIAAFLTRHLAQKSPSKLFTPWVHSPHLKALNISVSAPLSTFLSPLHSNLSNLTIFRIERDRDSTWHFIPEVASLLSRCPDMTELSLSGRYSLRHEKPILRLREIFSEIGQLEKPWRLQKLELKSVEVTPDDIRAHIRHLKHLTFLEILENPCSGSATTFGEIWAIFKQHGIALRELSTDHLEDPFYLHRRYN
ncbi:hypothetical protein AGABI1DRAFT_125570 [Agaricus bisporus var. burnettii JB137-S8]|uniref:F-box domain-containing protein n=1 Tax=Agaricus bisporus var. burnettii (strain JB137-S8 / ATCC MYA-4627 / FGSC 10392) TaxID=597362 RepID=K5X5I1_AGABU|nr:uncharacterized protein AGABI1DRAFT_125570 [Agaricus bisporus var. burnettii JB137-S8]EKM83091.1 hypothetical protein AGABI1DRAFT_125570 [Agaricus bisporus var. burnettii JB137-S8]